MNNFRMIQGRYTAMITYPVSVGRRSRSTSHVRLHVLLLICTLSSPLADPSPSWVLPPQLFPFVTQRIDNRDRLIVRWGVGGTVKSAHISS